MGSSPDATLAYGYDLGSGDDFKTDQRGEWGSPAPAWYDEEADPDFVEQMFNHLYAQIPDAPVAEWDHQRQDVVVKYYGVDVEYSGSHDYPGWILVAAGSDRSVSWAETMALDLDEMAATPGLNDWDAKLAAAVAALGITPTQDRPRWLVFPFYG